MTSTAVRHHLFITGTGRAGTSFLVRYLTTLGLDTILSRQGDKAGWDENANAGLEQRPTEDLFSEESPYVIKSPLLHEYIDEVLATPTLKLDAVILPIRDVMEASASRLILERRSIYEQHPWMAELDASWETWGGSTPGGALYSLNAVDQARIISAAFYKIVERTAAHDIPMVFLHFPRFAEDAEYLYAKLKPYLPQHVTSAQALQVHRALADTSQIRVSTELVTKAQVSTPRAGASEKPIPTLDDLDRIASKREIVRLNKMIADFEIPPTSRALRWARAVHRLRKKLKAF